MPPDLPHDLEKELPEVERISHAAFEHVTREGGVSWSESVVIDRYGTDEQRHQARELDTDTNWNELIGDPDWFASVGLGGFSFLDPIGFRYYLPAAMIRTLRGMPSSGNLDFFLHLDDATSDLRDYRLNQWSLLDFRQRCAVARFLRYEIAYSTRNQLPAGIRWWTQAYSSYWSSIED